MLNDHNIILLLVTFITFYPSFNGPLLMRKSCNYKVMKKKIKIVLKNSLDPEPGSDFWLEPDPDSMNMDPQHCSLK